MTSRSRSLKFLRKPAAIAAVAAAGMLFLPGTAHAASIAGYVGQSCDGASTVGTFVLAATYDQIEFVQLTVSQNGSVVYDTGKVDISAAPLDDPNTLNVIEGGVTRSTVLAPGDYTYTWVDYWKDGGGPFGADVHGNTPFTVTAGQCTAPTTTTTTTPVAPTTVPPTTTTTTTDPGSGWGWVAGRVLAIDPDRPGRLAPLDDVVVRIDDASGRPVRTVRTGRDGRYTFAWLPSATYRVWVEVPSGLVPRDHPDQGAGGSWLLDLGSVRVERGIATVDDLVFDRPATTGVMVGVAGDFDEVIASATG
ncbi:MAG: hypothetical protein KDA98_12185 [Acidimicrobiales bacterium]|nr:hypothetical protein [Acidimicrobiales bacterium]